jgi:TRAP-type C4-dicarboxylate transport system substrate-binding protein
LPGNVRHLLPRENVAREDILKALFALPLVAVLAAAPAAAQTVTLKFASWAPPNVNVNLASRAWAAAVEKDSGGAVKIEFYWETLANARTVYDAVNNGVADIGWILQPLVPGKFPRTSVVELPFLITNSTEGSVALWRLYEKGLIKEEYDQVRPIGLAALPPSVLHSKSPIPTVKSLAGLKFRIAGRVNAQMISSLNATGVQMAITSVYEAVSKGVLDGSLSPWLAFTSFKHHEVMKYHVTVPLGAVAGMMGMNNRTWESLPANVKAAMEKHSGAVLSASYGKYCDDDMKATIEEVRALPGHTIGKFTDEEIAGLEKLFEPIVAGWAKSTPNGEAVLKIFREELADIRAKK